VRYSLINAGISLSPNEIIQRALGLPLEKSKRISLGKRSRNRLALMDRKYTLTTSYHLTCPSLHEQLRPNTPIGEQGIVNYTVLLLVRREQAKYDSPEDDPSYGVCAMIERVRGVQHFNELVRTHLDKLSSPDQHRYYQDLPSFMAVLLYTDEDTELAKYVRLNFASLDKMSGSDCKVFVIERPPQMKLSEIVDYWKELLTFGTYALWGSVGWTSTKPYDKSSAYHLAQQLGVFPHQLPCIVFFDEITDEGKVIIPIQGEPVTFFRELFGSLQTVSLAFVQEPEYWRRRSSQNKRRLAEIRERIVALSKRGPSEGRMTVYNFHGHTVFINQPSGSVQLRNFQNTPGSPATTSE
jgi:hypothetical protein